MIVPHLHEALLRAGPTVPADELIQADRLLSLREFEVLKWVMSGKTSCEISVILGLSERTVKFDIKDSMCKLGANTRAHAVAIAVERGLIPLE